MAVELKVFALPFKQRKRREIFFSHRPDQVKAVSPDVLCKALNIPYVPCYHDTDITDDCDVYLIAGAGLLSQQVIQNKPIINCHPGIIPAARGLDSFKWSIYSMLPLGNTLHYLGQGVDDGEIISVIPTPIFVTDSLETLARRHYENEVNILSHFIDYIDHPINHFDQLEKREATMRMPFEIEVKTSRLFEEYKEKYALPYTPLCLAGRSNTDVICCV